MDEGISWCQSAGAPFKLVKLANYMHNIQAKLERTKEGPKGHDPNSLAKRGSAFIARRIHSLEISINGLLVQVNLFDRSNESGFVPGFSSIKNLLLLSLAIVGFVCGFSTFFPL